MPEQVHVGIGLHKRELIRTGKPTQQPTVRVPVRQPIVPQCSRECCGYPLGLLLSMGANIFSSSMSAPIAKV